MEEKEKDDGFCIKVYSPGNLIAKTINISGGVHLGGDMKQNGFSDEQIAKALMACVGKGRVIDNKWKWAGAYWFLRWNCNYPVDAQKFCDKINSLAMDIPSGCDCSYESIRKICTLSFMNYDVRNWGKHISRSPDFPKSFPNPSQNVPDNLGHFFYA